MMTYAQLEARVKALEAVLSELVPAMQALQKENEELKAQIQQIIAEKDAELKAQEEAHKAEVAKLNGTLAILQRMVYGPHSEKPKYVLEVE